jgi:hypothetical protein
MPAFSLLLINSKTTKTTSYKKLIAVKMLGESLNRTFENIKAEADKMCFRYGSSQYNIFHLNFKSARDLIQRS